MTGGSKPTTEKGTLHRAISRPRRRVKHYPFVQIMKLLRALGIDQSVQYSAHGAYGTSPLHNDSEKTRC